RRRRVVGSWRRLRVGRECTSRRTASMMRRMQLHPARLYLVRHGETDWNRERRFQGTSDIPLNELGRAQSRALAQRLTDARLDAVYTSPLSRAVETARIV